MDEQRLAEIERRAAQATPGPWYASDPHPDCGEIWVHSRSFQTVHSDGYREDRVVATGLDDDPDDAAFIAHARADIPDLIAEIRRLQRQLEATLAPATAQGNRGPGWTTAERMFWHYAVTEP